MSALNRHLDREAVADVVEFFEKHNNDKTSRSVLSKLIEDLGLMRLNTCGNLYNPTPSENGVTHESLAGIFVGVMSPMKQNRFLRDGLRKRISASSSMSSLKPAMTTNLPIEKRSGWRISNTSPSVVRYCAEMLNICLETTRKPLNTTEIATLKGGNSDQHAFIIQMGNYTFVEFSTAGACYVYDNANLPFELGDSEVSMSELRNQE